MSGREERKRREERENFLSPYSYPNVTRNNYYKYFLPYLTPDAYTQFEWFLVTWLILQHWIVQKISKAFQSNLSLRPDFPSTFPTFSNHLVASISSIQFCCSIMSNSLQPHGLQYIRPLCPSPTPGACSNSCLSSWWCYPTISSSVIPFSSCLQSFAASGSFLMSQLFTSDGQSIEVSASAICCKHFKYS